MFNTQPHRLTLGTTLVAMLLAIIAGMATPALAISPGNPYRSFNLSGINYGSMRWEQQHRKGQTSPSRRSKTRRSKVSRPSRTPSTQVIEGGAAGSATSGDQRSSSPPE